MSGFSPGGKPTRNAQYLTKTTRRTLHVTLYNVSAQHSSARFKNPNFELAFYLLPKVQEHSYRTLNSRKVKRMNAHLLHAWQALFILARYEPASADETALLRTIFGFGAVWH
jgi:hypothetical protein